MGDFIERLTEFEIRYGDLYELWDAYDDIPTELARDIEETLQNRKYEDLLEDLTMHMEAEDSEESEEAFKLWKDLRKLIAEGE